MRVRLLMALAGLALALVAQPARAENAHFAVLPDGTYSHNIFTALLQQQDATVRRDSVKTPVVALLAAGGALGLASYFVLGSNDTPALGGRSPLPPPGGLVPPPQITWTPNPPAPPGGPTGGPNPPGDTPQDPTAILPTTTTPEPVTMALLASGLAGMGGMSLLRRRKQS